MIADNLRRRGILLSFTPNNSVDVNVDEDFGLTEAVATLDNGDFGTRTVRFETCLLYTSDAADE